MDKELFKEIGINILKDTPAYKDLQEGILGLEKYQNVLLTLQNNADDMETQTLRIGTILMLSIANMMVKGKQPKDFSKEDWKKIADEVSEYGIMMEGDRYSLFVFDMYSRYIDLSLKINSERLSEANAKEIKNLSEELRQLGQLFNDNQITEPDYVDRCLWTCLEALIKLFVAYKTHPLGEEYATLLSSISDFSFQYARLKMYEREKELLDEYVRGQYVLDDELKKKYKTYIDDLTSETDRVNALINNAFSPDFRDMLRSSADLARETGVSETEILDSVEKIDDYFS